jgi:hypothetical protein
MKKLIPIVLITIAVAGVTGVEFAGKALGDPRMGLGDPCPDPGHCTCRGGVLHDALLQFTVNDGCFKCGVSEYNPDGLCTTPP